ncbi:protein phosphatase 2C family protein [Striga asiatica]|uniref:protein-serine/threonine phosphatase n=1 Tax=Striga asiatica TaxID=4170 RepID=A0A5A7PBQ8_STRAF|nr:protein phosphatase 2C family protein [Striga asiatica]
MCESELFPPQFLLRKMGCIQVKCCRTCSPTTDDFNEEENPGVHPGPNNARGPSDNIPLDAVHVPSHNLQLSYAALSHRGYYPDAPDKENQDSYCVKTAVQGNPNIHFFGVFDGHGLCGAQCSSFVKDTLFEKLSDDPSLPEDPISAYSSAFLATNDQLHTIEIDDSMSGTTAITALVIGDKLYVANVGDSRAVLGVRDGDRVLAQDLSYDQTPFRKDECERVKLCGARVLSVDQVEGIKDPGIQSWGDEESDGWDPPRVWVQDGMYPGTAFTRSVGDSMAEKIGVVSDPEVSTVSLAPEHPFFVVASDGVFEFLSSQTVVDMFLMLVGMMSANFVLVAFGVDWKYSAMTLWYNGLVVNKYADPREACSAIADESYKLWLEHENRTDDITIIIVHIKDLNIV